jgi:hypothetical protein
MAKKRGNPAALAKWRKCAKKVGAKPFKKLTKKQRAAAAACMLKK